MPPLTGRHVNKIDRKGRVSVPKLFRDALVREPGKGLSIYVYPSFHEPAIEGATEEFMTHLSDSIHDLALFSEEQSELASIVLGTAHCLPLDPEGRIVLPGELIRHAGLAGEAAFVGLGPSFQIWQPAAHEEHVAQAFKRLRDRGATLKLLRESARS